MSQTPICSWKRAFKKYSPSTDVQQSPAIQTQGKLQPNSMDDGALTTAIWGLTTHEEYYYQNFIELISLNKLDFVKTNMILKLNRIPSYWSNRLTHFQVLGQGAFGRVFKTTDALTNETYALKEVTSYNEKNGQLLKNTVMIMTERNAHFRANESAFVVKLHGAFQDSQLMSYWLIFEYCVGDLSVYITFIKSDIGTYFDRLFNYNILNELYSIYKDKMNLDIEKIACVFGFELLAGIAYLADRNLLHNDLKPENVLVSSRGHLKISDLGLTHRFRWLDRWSSIEFTEPSTFKTFEEKDMGCRMIGNVKYTDPEVLIYFGVYVHPSEIYKRFKNRKFPLRKIHQHFLTDLYGVALIMLDLLFAGMNIITTRKFTIDVSRRFKINRQIPQEELIWPIRCLYDEDVKLNYLERILDRQKTSKNASIIKFLKSIFLPRAERAKAYTKNINHMKLKEKSLTRCIDIEKIKQIEYFLMRGFNEYNVTTMDMPQAFTNIYTTDHGAAIAETFDELLSKIEKRCKANEQELRMAPFDVVF